MTRSSFARLGAAFLLVLGSVGAAAAAEGAGRGSPVDLLSASSAPSTALRSFDEWEQAAALVAAAYSLPRRTALERVADQEDRWEFREAVAAELGDTFAGFSYDYTSDVQTVLTTDAESARPVVDVYAEDHGVSGTVTEVPYSYDELARLEGQIQDGEFPELGRVWGASVDQRANVVTAYVDPSISTVELRTLQTARIHPAVRVAVADIRNEAPDVCTSKTSCGAPLRGGIVISHVGSNRICSLGYTATASGGSRWAITAGHCVNVDETWRHGEQYFGPVRQRAYHPVSHISVDVGRIRIDNSYWRAWPPGGYLLRIDPGQIVRESPNIIEHVLQSKTTLSVGDVVCLSARTPRWGDSCGLISSTDNGAYDMVQVGNYDACSGDSGGAWVWKASSGNYWAIGVHSSSRYIEGSPDQDCPFFDFGGNNSSRGPSSFTAVPDVHAFWDATGSEVLRIDAD